MSDNFNYESLEKVGEIYNLKLRFALREFPSLTKQVYCTPVLVASTPCIWKQTGYHTKVYIGENLPNRLGRLLDSMVGVNQGDLQPSTV
jgi:hypothetical protein